MLIRWVLILSVFIGFVGCSGSSSSKDNTDSPQVKNFNISDLGTFSVAQIAAIKNEFAANGLTGEQIAPTLCALHAYKISYQTKDTQGQPTLASGVLAIPTRIGGLSRAAMVSYQHGTTADRNAVPSRMMNSPEALFTGALYGGGCYIVVEADYLGLGDNLGFHPYLHAATEASATADLIRAVLPRLASLGITWNGQLFLAGYSQGGHATMALHRALEQAGDLTVTASAPMAGPYDLSKTSIQTSLQNPSPNTSGYASYIIFSYHHVYGAPAHYSEAVNSPMDTLIDSAFDGTRSDDKASGVFPKDPKNLITLAYQQDIVNQNDTPFLRALRDNDLYQWVPKAPVKLYHGEADLDVPFANSKVAYDYMHSRGARVEIVSLGAVDHPNGFLPATLGAYKWFNTLRK